MATIGQVDDIFELSGRTGLVVAPGIVNALLGHSVTVGAKITIVNPDGSRVATHVAAIEIARVRQALSYTPIMLSADVNRGELQRGAAIELVDGET